MRSAFGYVVRQRGALLRFLEDGRMRIDNNASFSLVASCKLHRLDPELYLRDVLRVVAQWPRDRFLELAPRNWAATRARLIEAELRAPVGWITVLPPPEEQTASS